MGLPPGQMNEVYSRPSRMSKRITIARVDSDFEREPLARPYGFKGGYISKVWQTAAQLVSESGISRVGLGTQNVLWSDADVFSAHSENGGNALMYALTERALQAAVGATFTTPDELLDGLLEEVYAYGKRITGNPNLREVFALNALVAVDNAAWLLYAAENGITSFDEMVPEAYRPGLSHRHAAVASTPAIGFASTREELQALAGQGYFVMKIKLGSPGAEREMLERDKERVSLVHEVFRDVRTEHAHNGKIPYYLDINQRYTEKDTLLRLLDHTKAIGAFDQVLLVEDPFSSESEHEVGGLGVRVISDEGAHTVEDALVQFEKGYAGLGLKAIAKTMSMTMRLAQAAHERGVPCLCADLTVNPILLEWNKNVAARLAPFPGIDTGLMEANGHQSYENWSRMQSYHPCPEAAWVTARRGAFRLDEDYYRRSGCILEPSAHYQQLFASRV